MARGKHYFTAEQPTQRLAAALLSTTYGKVAKKKMLRMTTEA
jgi:hypothetical protein